MIKYMKVKKILSILLVLCMLFAYVPVTGWAAEQDSTASEIITGTARYDFGDISLAASEEVQEEGHVFVGGVKLQNGQYLDTEGNVSATQPAGGYAYCESKRENGTPIVTLTLHDYDYTGIGMATDSTHSGAIYTPYETTIIIEGENFINAATSKDYTTLGIHSQDYLTIKGTGSIDFSAEDEVYYDYVIYAESGLSIAGGTINCRGSEYGIYVMGGLTVSGGDVTCLGLTNGIYVKKNLVISGGTALVGGYYEGVYVEGNLTVSGGIANVYGTKDNAIYVDKGDLTVSGGRLAAVTDKADKYYGIFVKYGRTDVTGGTLEVLDGGMYSADCIYLGEGVLVASPEGGYAHNYQSVYGGNGEFVNQFVITKKMLKGDLDLDGNVDSDDLTKLARHVGGIEPAEGQALLNADVTGDGAVNSDDLTKHARYVGGIITSWDQT